MKIFARLSLFIGVFIPALASAQFPVYQGPAPTPALQTTPFNSIAKGFATDEYLRQQCVIVSSTMANSPVRAEDSAFANADATMVIGGVNNRSLSTFNSTNGDVTPFSVSDKGILAGMLVYDSTFAGASTPMVPEDTAVQNAQTLVMLGAMREDTLAANTDTSADATQIKTNNLGALYTQVVGGTANGGTVTGAISAATNNATVVKASAGQVYSIHACNINAAVRYLKLYNKATAPTCGTDVPVMRIPIPASNCTPTIPFPIGAAFGTGIGFCIVTGAADTDNTATAANEQFVNITYK
jgi:hypothetical protein